MSVLLQKRAAKAENSAAKLRQENAQLQVQSSIAGAAGMHSEMSQWKGYCKGSAGSEENVVRFSKGLGVCSVRGWEGLDGAKLFSGAHSEEQWPETEMRKDFFPWRKEPSANCPGNVRRHPNPPGNVHLAGGWTGYIQRSFPILILGRHFLQAVWLWDLVTHYYVVLLYLLSNN